MSDAPHGTIEGFWSVIPAGGSGTRLWPLSRAASPKFLHDLTGSGQSMLRATWDRLAPLSGDRVLVVTGRAHAHAVSRQLPRLRPDRLVAEPSPRDSMPAIGLAAAMVEREDPEAVIGSFAADHVITDVERFHDAVRQAVATARTGRIVTIGIEPTHPATGFGYIRAGEPLGVTAAPDARDVRQFVEKPDAVTAAAYLATGEYRWNAGMFVSRAGVLLDVLAEHHPTFAATLREIAEDPSTLERRWEELTRIAIDHAVAEPAAAQGRVAVVPGTFGWDDVGDFSSLAETSERAAREELDGIVAMGEPEQIVALDTTGVVHAGSGRVVAVVGLHDIVVVDTPDALLVTTRQRAQDVKQVVETLRRDGRTDLL